LDSGKRIGFSIGLNRFLQWKCHVGSKKQDSLDIGHVTTTGYQTRHVNHPTNTIGAAPSTIQEPFSKETGVGNRSNSPVQI
jgi:hypothetical protein